MATRLYFQPIRGKALAIRDAIFNTEELSSAGQALMAVRMVVEEVVANIVEHAYPEGADGYMDVEIGRHDECISICFRDGGIPFNPLEHEAPDTSLSMAHRPLGGLGIFLVLKYVDTIAYEYTNHENVLTVSLKMNQSKR